MKSSFETPWVLALFLPDGSYRTVARFPDRAAASVAAEGNPDLIVLFVPIWREQRRRSDQY